jgi:hypothetical protein
MPEGLLFCTIKGRLRGFDETDEAGMPLFAGMEGSGTITCNATVTRNTTAGQMETYFPEPVHFSVGADGYVSRGGLPYIVVLAPSPALNPPDFNYRFLVRFENGKRYGPFNFDVVPGGEVDLAEALPVDENGGVPVVQGPPGPPGPPGPAGPEGEAAAALLEAALRAEQFAAAAEDSRIRAEAEAAVRAQQFTDMLGSVVDSATGLIREDMLPEHIDLGTPAG